MYDLKGKRVWVAGHRGMVGSAVARRLSVAGADILAAAREELDLRRQADVEAWMRNEKPAAVVIAAATVGGIEANRTRPVDFLYDNLVIAANIIRAAAETGVGKLLFLGSSCFYPRLAEQPVSESALLTGPLEPTNEWYAVAKIAGVKLCQAYRRQFGKDFIALVPTNLYGPGDHFDPLASHVIAALIRKIHVARVEGQPSVAIWGTGEPRREFLYVDDAADAIVFLLERYSGEEIVNVAGGEEVSIRGLATLVADVVGYNGTFRFDTSKPDGMPRKVLSDCRLRALGWRAATPLKTGLAKTYEWFLSLAAAAEEKLRS